MNSQTQITAAPQSNSVGLLNLEAFELSQRVAKMLSSSTLVPEQYRSVIKVKAGKDQSGQWMYRDEENPNGLSNCIIALNMANRMGADPLMIMQNLYLIEGRPSWSSQFIMASINSCGRFSALRFDLEDLGEKEVEYQETSWAGGRKQNVTKKIKIQNFACTAWAIERETGERLNSSKITIEMAVKEGWYQKNGSKWQTMPEQMLRYRAASFFGRVYAPELLMGLKSAEEEQDQIIDVTPDQELVVKADTAQLKREILAVKSPAELNALEEKVFDIADDSARKELTKLVNAQAQKFQPKVVEEVPAEEKPKKQPKTVEEAPVQEVAHTENGGVSVDELKRLQQEAETVVQQMKQPSSADMKREYAKALNTAKSLADVLDIEEQIENDNALTQADFQYLQANIEQVRAKFEQQQAPAVDPIKSGSVKNGLTLLISDAKNGEDLRQVAQQMNAAKPNLTSEHQQELLQAYQQKKKLIEDQMDMFPNK
ncbi:MAG TPA: recombinase RecT [Acinetobacter radioresistens]|uniref:Recombinase RecT n=1 Tax=Acinetobacter radioresistens TaxID=40216 RepID=A0A3D3G1D0_ACIRA|nr:recombinase RecT [Acinetobacter radioresistens]